MKKGLFLSLIFSGVLFLPACSSTDSGGIGVGNPELKIETPNPNTDTITLDILFRKPENPLSPLSDEHDTVTPPEFSTRFSEILFLRKDSANPRDVVFSIRNLSQIYKFESSQDTFIPLNGLPEIERRDLRQVKMVKFKVATFAAQNQYSSSIYTNEIFEVKVAVRHSEDPSGEATQFVVDTNLGPYLEAVNTIQHSSQVSQAFVAPFQGTISPSFHLSEDNQNSLSTSP